MWEPESNGQLIIMDNKSKDPAFTTLLVDRRNNGLVVVTLNRPDAGNAVNTEMVSLEELGKRLGVTKTHAWRLRNCAMDRLREIMLKDPKVLKRLRDNDATTDYGGL